MEDFDKSSRWGESKNSNSVEGLFLVTVFGSLICGLSYLTKDRLSNFVAKRPIQ